LGGPFLLDDAPNLNVISQLPANPGFVDIVHLSSTGLAGALGRSVSIFSFLLQHESWPNPYNFKLINVLLHLFNGSLLTLCCVLITRQWRQQPVPLIVFALITFIWLAHPIQVSTVLYVVQRMTLLSSLFSLLAILFYLFGRQLVLQERIKSGLALMLSGLTVIAALAVLSKENGVLLYLYILVLEYTLFAGSEESALLLRMRRALLGVTVVVGLVGLLFILPTALQGYELKPFSFQDRVLTQFPVLLTYLASIALLLPNDFGVFHDDFLTVQGPLLFLSIFLILGLLALALIKRKQWPLFAFAVLWYFAGHALESTFLPLEYYFEHRNYLPVLGPIFALVIASSDFFSRLDTLRRSVLMVTGLIVLLLIAITTMRQTTLWGNAIDQAYAAVEHHPNSRRAQSNLVEKLSTSGQPQSAFDYHMTVINPQEVAISPYIRWLEFSCILHGIAFPEDEVLQQQALHSPHDYGAIFSLNNLVFGILEKRCPRAPVAKLQIVLDGLVSNPNFTVSEPDILLFQALLFATEGNFIKAIDLASASFQQRPDVLVGLYQVNWLIRSGQPSVAAEMLQRLESNYLDEINASADFSARVQFLHKRLENPVN